MGVISTNRMRRVLPEYQDIRGNQDLPIKEQYKFWNHLESNGHYGPYLDGLKRKCLRHFPQNGSSIVGASMALLLL